MLSKPKLVQFLLPLLNKIPMAQRRDAGKCDDVIHEMRKYMREEENQEIMEFEQSNLVRVVCLRCIL
jgi:hypothetical protein